MRHNSRYDEAECVFVQRARALRTLVNTLLTSLLAILNVGSLLFLLLFVYAVLGVDLFGDPHDPSQVRV